MILRALACLHTTHPYRRSPSRCSPLVRIWFALVFGPLTVTRVASGILTLQPTSQPKTKAAGLTRHQLIMLALAVPCIAVGTFLIIFNKVTHDAPHFTSWHGTFGIIAITWLVS